MVCAVYETSSGISVKHRITAFILVSIYSEDAISNEKQHKTTAFLIQLFYCLLFCISLTFWNEEMRLAAIVCFHTLSETH